MSEPAPQLQRRWRCTFFPDRRALGMEEGYLSAGTLAAPPTGPDKHALPYVKLARFSGERTAKGCYRHDKGVTAVTGAEIDYDTGGLSIDDAADRLEQAGIYSLLYPSASYTEEEPRWRILLPFAREFVGTEDAMREYRRRAVAAAAVALGEPVANESYTLSQGFIFGRVEGKDYFWAESAGDFIDNVVDLTAVQTPPASSTAEHLLASAGQFSADFDLGKTIQGIVDGTSYHPGLNSLFGHWAATGMPLQSAITLAKELMLACPGGDERWQERFEDIERCAGDIYAKEARKSVVEPVSVDAFINAFKITQEDVKDVKETEFIYQQMIPRGHMIAVVGEPGAGKTTIMETVAADLGTAGLTVLYINADIGAGDMPQAERRGREGGYSVLCPDFKTGMSMDDVIAQMRGIAASGADLSNYVFIIDTLKKMLDVINKKAARDVYKLLRSLTGSGATVIALAHCNKYRDAEGWPVYEGTGDLRSDFDELVLLHGYEEGGVMTSSLYWKEQGWPTGKSRARVEALTWETDLEGDRTARLAAEWLDTLTLDKRKKSEAMDEMLVQSITGLLRGAVGGLLQKDIVEAMHEEHGTNHKAVRRVLKAHKDLLWDISPAVSGRGHVHTLLAPNTPPN